MIEGKLAAADEGVGELDTGGVECAGESAGADGEGAAGVDFDGAGEYADRGRRRLVTVSLFRLNWVKVLLVSMDPAPSMVIVAVAPLLVPALMAGEIAAVGTAVEDQFAALNQSPELPVG